LTEFLGDVLTSKGISQSIKNCNTVLLWGKVVEGEVKKNTEALKVQNRTLYVMVKNSVWAQELTFLKKDIIKKINEAAGYGAVADIRFKVGDKVGKD